MWALVWDLTITGGGIKIRNGAKTFLMARNANFLSA